MLVTIIPIGNSRGIRLPKAILDQLDVSDQMEMEVENRQIILKPLTGNARKGWQKAFAAIHAEHEEAFEWEW